MRNPSSGAMAAAIYCLMMMPYSASALRLTNQDMELSQLNLSDVTAPGDGGELLSHDQTQMTTIIETTLDADSFAPESEETTPEVEQVVTRHWIVD